jgi:tripartite-type tricarboxylate transporter receptor subunit TctC
MFFSSVTQMLPYIRDGRLRGLAVTSATRSPLAPDIPTMEESEFDQFVTAGLNFIVTPPGTPIDVRHRLSDAVARALASDQVKAAFAKIGAWQILLRNKRARGETFWLGLFAHVVTRMLRASCAAPVAGRYVQAPRSERRC